LEIFKKYFILDDEYINPVSKELNPFLEKNNSGVKVWPYP
jgi:hypothetical protein